MWKADRMALPGQETKLRNATALLLHRLWNVAEHNHNTTPCTIGNERIRLEIDSRGRATKLRRSSHMPNAPGFTQQVLARYFRRLTADTVGWMSEFVTPWNSSSWCCRSWSKATGSWHMSEWIVLRVLYRTLTQYARQERVRETPAFSRWTRRAEMLISRVISSARRC